MHLSSGKFSMNQQENVKGSPGTPVPWTTPSPAYVEPKEPRVVQKELTCSLRGAKNSDCPKDHPGPIEDRRISNIVQNKQLCDVGP